MRILIGFAALTILVSVALADPAVDLQSPLAAVRVQAARAMGQVGDRSAVPGLVKALKDPSGPVRREAAAARISRRTWTSTTRASRPPRQ